MNEVIHNLLNKGVSKIINNDELTKKLLSGKKLRIKFGIDPTGTIVHIGHAVPMLKLAEFQKLGHQIVIIIGDSTAQVGDSSDKNAERPMLTREDTLKNAEMYLSQFAKILDISKLEVHYNSEWMDTTNFNQVGELAKLFSVSEMLDRDNFSKRFKSGVRISLQEFLYPIMQGWDSVKVNADVELGGNDQYFNLLAGRTIQEAYGQTKQDIMMFNLIEGTDGRKMSKSYGNCISISEKPNTMYSLLMEVNDDLIIKYFIHCTTLYINQIKAYEDRLNSGENPRNVKMDLAREIVKFYHGEEASLEAEQYFKNTISGGVIPDEKDIEVAILENNSVSLYALLKEAGFFSTSGEAINAVEGGGVKIDNIVEKNPKKVIELTKGIKILIQVGRKKFKYVTIK